MLRSLAIAGVGCGLQMDSAARRPHIILPPVGRYQDVMVLIQPATLHDLLSASTACDLVTLVPFSESGPSLLKTS